MTVALTIFKSVFDNKTHRRMEFDSFDGLEELLHGLSRVAGYKPKKGEKAVKEASPLITPAVFRPGTTRSNSSVECWAGWAALDIDDYPTGGFDLAIAAFDEYRNVCYSSASSTQDHPKFRAVLPLTESVPADRIRHFWYALNREFKSLADPQTKDLSRMYYVPAQYPNAYNFIRSNRDKPILNPRDLMAKYPYVQKATVGILDNLPESVQRKVEEYRRSNLTNSHKYTWTSYRNCPFVKKHLISEYRSISSTGWYGKMYQIMASIAATAIRRGYPITPTEIASLCRELDRDTGSWYKNRGMETEAARAISFALRGAKH